MSDTLQWRHTAVLITALMATGIGQSLVFAILAPLGREVALSELQITSIISLSALAFGLASPFWGRVSDRVGRKPIIIVGLIGYTIGTLIFTSVFYAGLAGMIGGLSLYVVALVARCAQSLVMSAAGPASTAYAADHTSPAGRTRAMAKLGTANSLGMILGPAVSGALAAFGLLAPLYFAGALSACAALLVWRMLPITPPRDRRKREGPARLRFSDPRLRAYVLTAIALFTGFSAIQQTLGFLVQDTLELDGIATAQMTGAALMVSAIFTFTVQVTAMQWLKLQPGTFIRLGLLAMLVGAAILGGGSAFLLLAAGMAFLGAGLGLTMPAIIAGASLAVSADEQGGAAGLIAACPAIGFVAGPLCGGLLYQVEPALAPLFAALIFFLALLVLALGQRSARSVD
ncbi:MFS transporter [Chromatocurvus halotolerans]|uniref:Putative MFS family arabinose efflux permease n=1 Tax=Chromatocurvus halotolerans TaxID=1132028 RepID=A0A4R2KQX9_9GAMM|nr:MFS transporter [Chromatocurvus halotolerans]TCO75107.1 putative MFS family arabinose efflux permease [Chromatocurvus halotolerans]